MKKFKKLLAGLLAGAMMLGSMTTTAFAEDAAGTTKRTVTPATIDADLKGSLTIHKYEYNNTNEVEGADRTGTGEASDVNKVPKDATDEETGKIKEGAKALAGAGFTIYKVADFDGLTDYYSTSPTDLPSIGTYVKDGKIKPAYANNKVGQEIKTDANGLAEFTDLELGFYVVIETTTPDKVTTPVTPFLVSIPMTTVDGADWLYDVHVFPKNKTTYGGVTLKKIGNRDEDTKLSGVTFVLQKQIAGTWTPVEKNESTGAILRLVTDKKGEITVDGLSQGTYRFIETSRGNNDGYIMDGATPYEFVVGADGKITYNGNTENNITITVNNEKPDLTKQVKERGSDDNWRQDADYNVGDMVPYKITIDVPSNITRLKEFTLTDTPNRLDDKENTIVLKDKDGALIQNTSDKTIYSVTKQGHGFIITFITENMDAYKGQKITVEYSAELLGDAFTTTDGNPNTAKLEYSNKILPGQDDKDNPNKPENPNEKPGKDTIKDNAIVYTFKLQIVKKADNATTGTPLKDVEFDLYKEAKTDAEKDNAVTNESAKAAGLDTSKKWLKINGESLKTNEDGEVSQSGLANGKYYLVETKTKKDYNLLKEPVEVTLAIKYVTSMSKTWEWENGVLVKHEITSSETSFTENEASSVGIHTETIINKKGFTLPSTGGMGTVIFSVLGIALVLAGLLVITASRKKAAK